jgi:DNA-binding NtrC family response regulator
MGHIVERLCRLIGDRYRRRLSYVELNPYSDSKESPVVDIVIRNRGARKIVSGNDLIVPVYAGELLAGAAVLDDGISLSEAQIDEVISTIELVLGEYIEVVHRIQKTRQLESHLSTASGDNGNVYYLHQARTKNKPLQEQVKVGRHQGPYLTQILIEGKNGIPFKEIAFDIHQRSGRSSFISWTDLDASKITEPEHIAELGPLTIFVPNLADLSQTHQAILDQYLLNLMDEFTPRVMAAVNTPLNILVESGALRSSLGFYFSKIYLRIPPLVERKEDILELVDFFSKAHSQGQKDLTSYGLETLSYLTEYDWPGNEKELETEIQKIVEHKKDKYGIDSLPVKIVGAEAKALYRLVRSKTNLKEASEELESRMLTAALNKAGGNKSEASRLLGLSRSALLEKLERLEKSGSSSREP